MSEAEQRKKKQKLWPVAAKPKGGGRDIRNAPFSMPQLAQWQIQDGHSQQLIQIETSVLHPQLNYKTVLINREVTVQQVVEMMVERHAIRPTDENPDDFLLTECVESPRGNYTRVLDNDEVVLDIQDRWQDNEGYFKLCQRPSKQEEDEKRKNGMLFEDNASGSELTATVLPPSESLEDLQFSPARPWREDKKRRLSLPSSSMPGEGMSEIMTRVVLEGEQMRSRKGTWSVGTASTSSPQRHKAWEFGRGDNSPKQDKHSPLSFICPPQHRSPLLSSRQKKEVIRIQPLFYSPSMSAKREYPQFVFNPPENDDKGKNEVFRAESPVSHDFMVVDSTIVQKSVASAFDSNSPAASARIFKSKDKGRVSANMSFTSNPDNASRSEDFFSYSTEMDQNTFHSDMNLLDSLSSILEAKFSTLGGRKLENLASSSQQESESDTKASNLSKREELISPHRRSRLLEEACSRVRRQRSQSCPTFPRNAYAHVEESTMNQRCVSTSPLISPSRRNKLIEAASRLVRKQGSERLVLATKTSPLITHRLLYTSPQVSPTLFGTSEKGSCESFVRSVDTCTSVAQVKEVREDMEKSLPPSSKSKQADSHQSAVVQRKIKTVSKLFSFGRRGNRGRERSSTEGMQSTPRPENPAKYKLTRSTSDYMIQANSDSQNGASTGQ